MKRVARNVAIAIAIGILLLAAALYFAATAIAVVTAR